MSQNEQEIGIKEIGIKRYDGCVELRIGNSVFRLTLDQRGLPEFPESVKESLPPYIPEMVEKLLQKEGRLLIVQHEPWCSEMNETGRCDCDPIIGEPFEDEAEQLTCSGCEESSTGEFRIHPNLVEDICGNRWLVRRSLKEDMLYWALEEDNFSTILCHKCLERIMTENGREFSDMFPDEDEYSDETLH
jgi:hypothetical protein